MTPRQQASAPAAEAAAAAAAATSAQVNAARTPKTPSAKQAEVTTAQQSRQEAERLRREQANKLKEELDFLRAKTQKLDVDKVKRTQGMDITIVTSASNDDDAYELLKEFGMPFDGKR